MEIRELSVTSPSARGVGRSYRPGQSCLLCMLKRAGLRTRRRRLWIQRGGGQAYHDPVSSSGSGCWSRKWCPGDTTFVRQMCDDTSVVTAKAQFNLKNAKQYFGEHLAVGDYYFLGALDTPVQSLDK